ncbi:MAG: hypothetical protein LBI74_04030 [Synergistaceae bacterium]|jgi:tetratricopeptide (TPR) repeat protein|nr:hypothetical protein [Synergistaceae bacterium]
MKGDEELGNIAAEADKILEEDPYDPIAMYIAWQAIEDDDESVRQIDMLEESVRAVKRVVDRNPDAMSEDAQFVYTSMLSDLAAYMYLSGSGEEAMEIAEEFKKYDVFCNIPGRLVFYATIIEKYDFNRVMRELELDKFEDAVSQYCKAIALYELDKKDVTDAFDALLNAVSMAPEMVFHILGMCDDIEPEDFDEDEFGRNLGELRLIAAVMADLWSLEDDRLVFLGHVTFALAYLTDRITDEEEIKVLESSYDEIDILSAMNESRDKLRTWAQSGRSKSDIDEKAIQILREMRDVGLFQESLK